MNILHGSGHGIAAVFQAVTTSRSWTRLSWTKNTHQILKMLSLKCRIGTIGMTINAKAALPEDLWMQALRHIHMQTQMLQLDMVQRVDEKWLCEISNMDLNIKLIEDKSISEVYSAMFKEGIEKSPWKIRIIPAKPNDVCALPAIKKEYPYQYYFVYLANHGFSDAHSNLMIFKRLLELLGDILIRRDYSDRLPFGKFTNGEELRQVRSDAIAKLENNFEKLQREKEILESTIKTPLLNEAFSFTGNEIVTTKYSHHILEEKCHQLFVEKCKNNGIRFSSGIVAAINTAVIEMVTDAGLQKEFYHISVMQNVDMRRYLKNKHEMGLFVSKFRQSYQIPSAIRKEYWKHGKEINSRTSELLKNDGPLIQEAVTQLTLPLQDPAARRGPQQMDCDYTFNFVSDLTPAVYVPSDQVQITDIYVNNITHNFNPFQIIFYTFRGVAKLSLNYSTDCLTEDMAQELMDRVLNVIRDMAF